MAEARKYLVKTDGGVLFAPANQRVSLHSHGENVTWQVQHLQPEQAIRLEATNLEKTLRQYRQAFFEYPEYLEYCKLLFVWEQEGALSSPLTTRFRYNLLTAEPAAPTEYLFGNLQTSNWEHHGSRANAIEQTGVGVRKDTIYKWLRRESATHIERMTPEDPKDLEKLIALNPAFEDMQLVAGTEFYEAYKYVRGAHSTVMQVMTKLSKIPEEQQVAELERQIEKKKEEVEKKESRSYTQLISYLLDRYKEEVSLQSAVVRVKEVTPVYFTAGTAQGEPKEKSGATFYFLSPEKVTNTIDMAVMHRRHHLLRGLLMHAFFLYRQKSGRAQTHAQATSQNPYNYLLFQDCPEDPLESMEREIHAAQYKRERKIYVKKILPQLARTAERFAGAMEDGTMDEVLEIERGAILRTYNKIIEAKKAIPDPVLTLDALHMKRNTRVLKLRVVDEKKIDEQILRALPDIVASYGVDFPRRVTIREYIAGNKGVAEKFNAVMQDAERIKEIARSYIEQGGSFFRAEEVAELLEQANLSAMRKIIPWDDWILQRDYESLIRHSQTSKRTYAQFVAAKDTK